MRLDFGQKFLSEIKTDFGVIWTFGIWTFTVFLLLNHMIYNYIFFKSVVIDEIILTCLHFCFQFCPLPIPPKLRRRNLLHHTITIVTGITQVPLRRRPAAARRTNTNRVTVLAQHRHTGVTLKTETVTVPPLRKTRRRNQNAKNITAISAPS